MVIGNPDATTVGNGAGGANNSLAHPSGIPQDKIDNIMSGIANTGDVKMNNHRKKLRQRFDIIKKLGQGTYGKVQLGINKETGQEVAIKTIKKCKIEAEADLIRIRREVQIMSSVQHPNIIHIYEVFENREKMVLVMEFAAGGELYDYLSERKVLNEEEARRIFRQVSTAVYYCHKHKICHRDLKLENILLDEHGNAKIADFGLSNVFDDKRQLATFCGSPLYASPEIVEGTPYQGPEVDCWSLGVLLYTLVYGSMPFDGSNFKRLVKQISQGDYYEPKKPSRASSLIRDMLTVCPRKRATIEQICSHWWVNENDNLSCLDLAENLANQTPVRLDVLLSLTPVAVTADQLVVPSADGGCAAGKGNERVPRSHSVGSILEMPPNTEAERRILDMVAAGGEAALMPSPTRTITPAQSPVQTKRKLELTVSTENAVGAVKKKEKPGSNSLVIDESTTPLDEDMSMETENAIVEEPPTPAANSVPARTFSQKDMELVNDICEQLLDERAPTSEAAAQSTANESSAAPTTTTASRQKTFPKLDAVAEAPEEKEAAKVIKKFVNKHKTADLVNAIGQITPDTVAATGKGGVASATPAPAPFVRKCSLQDDTPLTKINTERRKSRILETAEKFAAMNANNGTEKPKKFVIPGVNVGSFKKEFERKASIPTPQQGPTPGERRALEQVAAAAAEENECASGPTPPPSPGTIEGSDSKNSVSSVSLEDARRSMENSIALLRQAQQETSKEVDQLCAKTETIGVSDKPTSAADAERERKLKNARAIIGNAIQPIIRRPPHYGIGGGGGYGHMRAFSGGFIDYDGHHCDAPPIINTTTSTPSSPYTTLPPLLPSSQMPPLLAPNANVALAAARQNIMGRFAAGTSSHSRFHTPNSLSYSCIQNSYPNSNSNLFYNNSNSNSNSYSSQQQQIQPQLSNQVRLRQQQQLHQQVPQDQVQKQLHHMSIPPSLPSYYAASASVATAANAATTATAINSVPKPFYHAPPPTTLLKFSPGGDPNASTVKTSTASITLKSATLPRRKTAKTEIQLDIKPRIVEHPTMRFTTEMQHPVPDLRSAPAREGPSPFSPISTTLNARAASLEPKEHIIPIQRPQTAYTRTTSNTTTRSGSLSRQSTADSESDTTTANMSQSTVTGSSQPIKKSPREFIIPIAMEGGGFITPRERSVEPSESSHTTNSSRATFNSRLKPTRRIGSLLNDSSIEDGLKFHARRTPTGSKDTDEDGHFTLHKLRSSRPVRKISQENDSQSSGEEDDDDGFEILTAENLFSTLLQRVRALTNRMNVNNDLTSGFPNSSRLLNTMRQGQSPFWNQEPFASSQTSYTYSETVEKKQVRLNNTGNNLGAPWRHSMSRDLGNDMESMFSRTGATLPRGNKAYKTGRTSNNGVFSTNKDSTDGKQPTTKDPAAGEPLDLADLDLSRLRLSKKDLETLSSIAPGLPKCFQEQLLAKLPPTQARKLSRTLSMQNSPPTPATKVYKRSQSGGRGYVPELPNSDLREQETEGSSTNEAAPSASTKVSDESSDYNSSRICRRSLSRSRYDCESNIPTSMMESTAVKSRSSSVCRDDYGKSLCSSYTSEVSDKYKYYSPYLSKSLKDSSTESSSVSPQKRYSCISPRNSTVTALGRPPSGCLSPPPATPADCCGGGSGSLRRRSSQRRISRFLRPDFYDEPLAENPYQREKNSRERETQSVLREIRERSREPSRERLSQSSYDYEELRRRKHSLPGEQMMEKLGTAHVRNKSMDMRAPESQESSSSQEALKRDHRSLSRSREMSDEMQKHLLADKILQELQLLSAARTQQDKRLSVPREVSVERPSHEVAENKEKTQQMPDAGEEKTATLKRVKKIKPKDKTGEPSTDADGKITTTVVVKKVKRTVKKTESAKTPTDESVTNNFASTEQQNKLPNNDDELQKKESKLKRPKSYPTKELNLGSSKTEAPASTIPIKLSTKPHTIMEGMPDETATPTLNMPSLGLRESRLVRPKSYPASKLSPPKDSKKVIRSGVAIAEIAEASSATEMKSNSVSRQSTSEEKSLSATPTGKSSAETSSSSETRPTTIKKIIKISKKSKLAQPTPVSATIPTSPTGEGSKESSPSATQLMKEKSPEKKPSRGLFYAIGQKFEKLRDSALSKDKKAASGSASTINTATKKSSPDNSSPEKFKDKSTLLRKKKSVESNSAKTDSVTLTETAAKASKTPTTATTDTEKPIKPDKRSRIDAMIRSLRERSVPRATAHSMTTETNYIKRAVSVENVPGTFNKNTVNKVLGLFKRFDKDGSDRRVRNTRSTSNIERQIHGSPPSPIYQNTINFSSSKHSVPADETKSKNAELPPASTDNCDCELTSPTAIKTQSSQLKCPDCIKDDRTANFVAKRREEISKPNDATGQAKEQQSKGNKDKRKGLMLELTKLDSSPATTATRSSKAAYINGNGIYSNLPPYPGAVNSSSNNSSSLQSMDNVANNNNSCMTNNNSSMQTSQTSGYRTSSAHEINRNHLVTTPSNENIANYSSDSRSYQDDCASTSTFLSPTDEPELYFDNWSVCSEDNYRLHATPSPTVSRLSRVSQFSSPTRCESSDPNESIIDRIKRRSFYCRFNEKKPKRTSSIVGPTSVRDYYREQQAAVKARSSNKINTEERPKSPNITHEFLRPLKLSPIGSELKPPVYKSPLDYHSSAAGKPRKSLNDIRPITSPSLLSKRFGSMADNDYLSYSSVVPPRYKYNSNAYDNKGLTTTTAGTTGYYNTYNPKRRSSYTLNGTLPSGSSITGSNIDGYATLGRRNIRPYDQRTMSLLDPPATSSFRREARAPVRDYTSTISRSSSRYRTSSATRSPTNI